MTRPFLHRPEITPSLVVLGQHLFIIIRLRSCQCCAVLTLTKVEVFLYKSKGDEFEHKNKKYAIISKVNILAILK